MKYSFIKKSILFLFVLSGCMQANAQTISDADLKIIEKIKQENTKYTSITSTFKQTKHISFLGEKVLSSGKFYYRKPDQLAMTYDQPAGDLMLINGDKFVMVSSGKRSETTSKANARMRGMKAILSSCLQGDIKGAGTEKIMCSESPQYYLVSAEIDKKANKSNISQIVLSFDKKDYTLSILQTIEPDGSYTIYELNQKELNKSVPDEVFQSN